MTDQQKLTELIQTSHRCVCIRTYEEEYALQCVRETAMELGIDQSGSALWMWTVSDGLRDGMIADSHPIPDTAHPAAAMLYLARQEKRKICVMLDLVGHLKEERTLRQFRDLLRRFDQTGSHLIMIDYQEEVAGVVDSHATRLELSLPDEKEIESILKTTVREINSERQVEVVLNRTDLRTMVRNLRGLNRRQVVQIVREVIGEDHRLDHEDIKHMLASKRRVLQQNRLLEFVETPVSLDEIGGLNRLKAWLKRRYCGENEGAAELGLGCPRGVLLLGVQGAGKSLCAKAIATAWQQPLLRLDPGALYDKYIGESEQRLRDALRQAEMMSPIVLWIDEIEKGFASAASRSTDGGLSQRMFGSLLTWMQEHTASVFLVATANDIEALPPELLRKGRFDEIFFVDLPSQETRRQIFAIHLKKRKRDPQQFDLNALSAASDGYSGAEIESALVSALYNTLADKTPLDTQAIIKALKESPPLSVTMAESVQSLRDWARSRCVPAD